MDIQILLELNKFNNIKFEENWHSYKVNGKRLTSVTKLIKSLKHEQDWGEIAEKYALKNGETAEYWSEKWRQEGALASEKGTEFHKYAENALIGKVYDIDIKKLEAITKECNLIDGYDPKKVMAKMKMMWDVFWASACNSLVPVRSEFIVGCEELGVAGMLDQLFWNKKAGEFQIWDWKTNKKIGLSNKFQKFKAPLQHLDECEFIEYSLQIGIYKYIIEKHLGIKIGDCYICHFNENNDTFKPIKVRDMRKEIELIFSSHE